MFGQVLFPVLKIRCHIISRNLCIHIYTLIKPPKKPVNSMASAIWKCQQSEKKSPLSLKAGSFSCNKYARFHETRLCKLVLGAWSAMYKNSSWEINQLILFTNHYLARIPKHCPLHPYPCGQALH